jgi:putative MATE family efflux protein
MQIDMTEGKILSCLLRFTWPLILGNLFQQVYNLTDMFIVGRFLGANAVAAVGAVSSLMFFLLGFLMGLTSGCTIVTAQRFGAGDVEGIKKSVVNATYINIIVAIVGTILGLALLDPVLALMRTPSDIYDQGRFYIMVIISGMSAAMLYNLIAGFMRAVGNSFTASIFLVLSTVLNVLLDIFFVVALHMGVEGAAIATVLAQGISGIGSLIYMVGKLPVLRVPLSKWKPDFGYIKQQCKLGLPMAIQFSITAAGIMVIQSALNTFGSTAVAGYSAAMKLDMFIEQPIFAIGMTMATFAAQNTGKKNYDRIKRGTLLMVLMVVGYGVFSIVLSRLLIADTVRFIIAKTEAARMDEIIDFANAYVINTITFTALLGLLMLARNVLQGSGYPFFPMIGACLEFVLRAVFSLGAAARGNYAGVCLAQPITWAITGAVLWLVFFAVFFIRVRRSSFDIKAVHVWELPNKPDCHR